ncbi:hypothetical protein V8F20_003495 [Naviculisporaceae sp. PSN 640]
MNSWFRFPPVALGIPSFLSAETSFLGGDVRACRCAAVMATFRTASFLSTSFLRTTPEPAGHLPSTPHQGNREANVFVIVCYCYAKVRESFWLLFLFSFAISGGCFTDMELVQAKSTQNHVSVLGLHVSGTL